MSGVEETYLTDLYSPARVLQFAGWISNGYPWWYTLSRYPTREDLEAEMCLWFYSKPRLVRDPNTVRSYVIRSFYLTGLREIARTGFLVKQKNWRDNNVRNIFNPLLDSCQIPPEPESLDGSWDKRLHEFFDTWSDHVWNQSEEQESLRTFFKRPRRHRARKHLRTIVACETLKKRGFLHDEIREMLKLSSDRQGLYLARKHFVGHEPYPQDFLPGESPQYVFQGKLVRPHLI